MQVDYKGKHAELCRAIEERRQDDAMKLIYAFFRSEENTDSYSIPALTIVRELMEDGDSDELSRLRIRMRGNGDKMLITLAQFVWALDKGGFRDGAEILAEAIFSQLSKMARSMQEFADEEGLSQATLMAGKRIREAMRILAVYFDEACDDEERADKCMQINLGMTRVFLFTEESLIAEDMVKASKAAHRQDDDTAARKLCEEMVESFGNIIESIEKHDEFSKDDLNLLKSVGYAYHELNKADSSHPYERELGLIASKLK